MPFGVSSAEFSHALTVAVSHPDGEIGWHDALITETNENVSLPCVFGKGKQSEVRGMVVGGNTVHVVGGHALGNEFTVLGDVGGMRGIHRFVISKSIFKTQVPLLAIRVVLDFAVWIRIRMRSLRVSYSAGWVNGDTFSSIRVAIESDVVSAMGGDITEEDVAVCERVTGSRVGVNV